MNFQAIRVIYLSELDRARRTMFQSLAAPVLSTALYFIVFGSAIGGRMQPIGGVAYGAFIVPGLILLTVLTESLSNASFGIYLPRFTGTIYEILSAPVDALEVLIGFVGAAATKSMILGLVIFFTAKLFVSFDLVHPVLALGFLALISIAFALFGFILGLWADGFEKLQIIPLMVVSPLTFLGGTFYSIDMLPKPWDKIALANPIVYLVDAFRWAFYDLAAVPPAISLALIGLMLASCMAVIVWIFHTGYRLRS